MTESQAFLTFLTLFSLPFWLPGFLRKYRQGTTQPMQTTEEPEEETETETEIDIEELAAAVDELQEQIKKIRKMQDAVSQIDACEPDKQHTNFLMKWQSTDGKNQSYDFWANGNSPTNDMLRELYQTEIDNLAAPLSEMAEKIYDLTHAE
jgi:hypothetical protein